MNLLEAKCGLCKAGWNSDAPLAYQVCMYGCGVAAVVCHACGGVRVAAAALRRHEAVCDLLAVGGRGGRS